MSLAEIAACVARAMGAAMTLMPDGSYRGLCPVHKGVMHSALECMIRLHHDEAEFSCATCRASREQFLLALDLRRDDVVLVADPAGASLNGATVACLPESQPTVTEPIEPVLAAMVTEQAAEAPVLPPAALHGLSGVVVEAGRGATESCDAAVLMHWQVGMGAMIGRAPQARAGLDPHPASFYVACVGVSSYGRKGMAEALVLTVLRRADPAFADRILTGLSSGEGLIHQVRDARIEQRPIRAEGCVTGYEEVEVDAGELDKRLLVRESEMASVLKRMALDGNTLSAVLRDAWDSKGSLATLTKHSTERATGAHVGLVAHVTQEELRRHLTATDQANGFANRFLWALAYRARSLPDPIPVPAEMMADLVKRASDVLKWARGQADDLVLQRDDEAQRAWKDCYEGLTTPAATDAPLVQATLARGAAQVLRLSALYAILDKSPVITLVHLEAALGVWQYCAESARRIFGDRRGDPVADAILGAVRRTGELTRTGIRDLFGRNNSADRIEVALTALAAAGLIVKDERETGGRPAEVWKKPSNDQTRRNDQRSSMSSTFGRLVVEAPPAPPPGPAPAAANSTAPRRESKGIAVAQGHDVERVWAAYTEIMDSTLSLTAGRRNKILTRLRDKIIDRGTKKPRAVTPDDLIAAIRACRASAFHMGDNAHRTRYNSLEDNILKNQEQMEKWLEKAARPVESPTPLTDAGIFPSRREEMRLNRAIAQGPLLLPGHRPME